MTRFFRDLLFAVRKFRRTPVLTIAAVTTLALGIGANTAIFSLVDGVWLRPLPITDPAHLVAIASVKQNVSADAERDSASSYAEYEDLRQRVPAFAEIAAVSGRGVVLDRSDGLKLLLARVVSDNYFEVLGAKTALGRLPSRQEMLSSDPPVMMLGYATWKTVFAGDPSVVGSTVKLQHGVARIVGVLAPGFRGTDRMLDPQVYVSQAGWVTWVPDERKAARTYREFDLYARLRPDATLDQARAQLQAAAGQLAAAYPEANHGRIFTAKWEREAGNDQIKKLSLLLLAIAIAVLLIACANLANLLLALNDARRREMAMRVALGAGRAQLTRQLVTEYCLLGVAGVTAAVVLAWRLVALVPALMPDIGYPLGFDFRIDGRVLAFTVAAGLLSVLLCGLLPGIASSQVAPIEAARLQPPQGRRLRMPARKVFVVAQLALSMTLLTVTGLLVRTLLHIEQMDMGFNQTQHAVLLDLAVSAEGPRRLAEFTQLAERVRALPGVQDATVARVVPFPDNGGGAKKIVLAPGETPSPTAGTAVWFNWIDDAYFRVAGVPLLRGRNFAQADSTGTVPVAIVNQTLAKRLFGTDDVVGRTFRLNRENPVATQIVGVARDGKYGDVTEAPQPYLYLPLTEKAWGEIVLLVPTQGDAAALLPSVRRAVREVDPKSVVLSAQTLTDHMQLATYANRMAAWLTGAMGGLALVLTMVGLYGVTAYSVSRRTREIGIRMALGAARGRVFSAVVREGLWLALAGLLLGAAAAWPLGRAIAGMLYGVKATDPLTWATVAAVVLGVSLLALVAPARRALRVEPMDALREE